MRIESKGIGRITRRFGTKNKTEGRRAGGLVIMLDCCKKRKTEFLYYIVRGKGKLMRKRFVRLRVFKTGDEKKKLLEGRRWGPRKRL